MVVVVHQAAGMTLDEVTVVRHGQSTADVAFAAAEAAGGAKSRG